MALVIKVQYGDKKKRFTSYYDGNDKLDFDLSALKQKICHFFNFGPDTDPILTYIDEDGDEVMLEDEDDFMEAFYIQNQDLNPTLINVSLKKKKEVKVEI